MALYFADTEITGIKDLFPLAAKDITGLYFADTELFTVWGEYDGTLPATYSANGSTLADYRVYGAAGGVGDRTENLFDYQTMTDNTNNIGFLNTDGSVTATSAWRYTKAIPVTGRSFTLKLKESGGDACLCFYDNNDVLISGIKYNYINPISYTVLNDVSYIRFSYKKTATTDIAMLVSGSTAPTEYIPYGYKVDMSVSDGTTSTTKTIYIGDTPLGEDEYIDYASGKIIRRTEQLWDGVLYDGFFNSKNFILNYSSRPGVYKSIKVWLQPGNYVLEFNPIVYMVRTLVNGEYSENSYNTEKVYFTVNSESYVGFSFRNTSNTKWDSNPSTISVKGMYSTDPPVPLPALPTVDGTNIVDYAGQSAAVPSRFVAKYRKEGFN